MPNEASLPVSRDAPTSRIDVLYWSCFLLGCGAFLPYNTLASAVDYLKEVYSAHEATRWTQTCYLTFTLLASLGNSFFPPKNAGHIRVSLGFFMFSLLLFTVPAIDWVLAHEDGGTDTAFLLLLFCFVLLGIFSGIVLGSFTGLMAHLPFQNFHGYLRGWGLAGILAGGLRAITKASFSDSTDGLRASATIYFFSSSLFCSFCLIVQRWVIVPNSAWEVMSPMQIEEQPLLDDSFNHRSKLSPVLSSYAESPWVRTVKKTKLATINTFVTFFTLAVVFPGVPSDAENEALGDWYKIMLVLLMVTSNFAIRLLPEKCFPNSTVVITAFVWVRTLLIPIIFFAMQYFANLFVISSLVLLFAASNGYAVLSCFRMAQSQVQGKNESFISGNILSFTSMSGLCAGAFGSLAWSALD